MCQITILQRSDTAAMDSLYPNMHVPANVHANVNPSYTLPSYKQPYAHTHCVTPFAYSPCHHAPYRHKISTEAILVLYILLVIILRTFHF